MRSVRFVFFLLALVLPWLVSPGDPPSPAIKPWLFSLVFICAAGMLTFSRRAPNTAPLALAFASIALIITLRGFNVETIAAASAIAVVYFSAVLVISFKSGCRIGVGIACALLITGLLSCLIALCQYFGISEYFEPWMSRSPNREAFGNLHQRNQFASLCNIALAAVVFLSRQDSGVWGRIAATPILAIAAMLLTVALEASASRTGLLGFMLLSVAMLLWGAWRERPVRNVLIVAWISYLLAAVLLPALAAMGVGSGGILARWQNGDPACASRLTLWSNVIDLIKLRPWLGWGWAELDFAHFTTLYAGPRFCEILDNGHNLPLHLAVELGIPAAAAICGVLLWAIYRGKPWRETDSTRQMGWLILAVILTHSLLEYPVWYGPFQIALGSAIGLLWQYKGWAVSISMPYNGDLFGLKILAPILLVCTAYAAWDYHRISQIYLAPADRSPAYRTDTLEKIRPSWLFHNQVAFAELTLANVTPQNAAGVNKLAHEVMHYSPEAKVVEKLIQSAKLLGRDEEVAFFEARYSAAYPEAYRRWQKLQD